MINVGLESIVSKVLQGGSVTYKVKLYDDLLDPVLAQENITVSFDYVLSGIAQGDFSNFPISTVIPIGSSEVLVSLDSINGGVVSIGNIAVSIQSMSAATGEYEAQLVKDGGQISLQVAEKQVKVNIRSIAVVKEGDAGIVNIDATNMDGSPTGLYGDIVVELGYAYPDVDAASIAETRYVGIGTTGNSSTSIQTYYTPYGSSKSVTVNIVGAYSSQDSDWVIVGTSTAELVVTGEVQLSMNGVVDTVYEGGVLQCKVALSDMLGNPVTCSTPISAGLLYTYDTALAGDIVPVSSVIIESGNSEVLVNMPTTKNVYQEGFKSFGVDLGTVSGGNQFSNFTVLESFVRCSINDEIIDYDPLNSESRDPVIARVESSSNEVEYGSSITYTVSTKDISGNAVVGVNGLYVPIVKEFYYENTLVAQEDVQVYIRNGVSQVTTTTNSLPLSGDTVDRVDVYVKNNISSVTGYEQYEQIILDSTAVSTVVKEQVIIYTPGFGIVGNNVHNGGDLVYNVVLNPNTVAASYSMVFSGSSTAVNGIDYTGVVCTNGVVYDSVSNSVSIPSGVDSFDIVVSTVVNETVGKEDKVLTVVLDGTTSASATIYNSIASVVSVGNAQGNEGVIITHEVVFSDVQDSTAAVGTLSNITTRVGDITGISVYWVNGTDKVYVANNIVGSTFEFDVVANVMYVEVSTAYDDIYGIDKTYRLDVGIVRNNPDQYSKNGIGTLLNVTPAPIVSAVSSDTVQEGSTAVVTVTLSNLSGTVTYMPISIGGTAQANVDYDKEFEYGNGVVNSSGMLAIPAYVGSFTIRVTTVDNNIYQTNRCIDVSVGGASGRVTLVNEEDKPVLQVTNTQVIEGGYGVLTLSMTKASATDTPIDLEFDILNQTAKIDDYVANIEVYSDGIWVDAVKVGSKYIVTIPTGVLTREIRVLTIDDNIVSGNKTLVLKANVQNEVTKVNGVINILDKDTAVIDVMDVTVQESDGVARIPIVMSKANANSVMVNVVTEDVTADSNDYVGINTVVTFPAGSTTQYVDVIIKQDNVYEGAETFKVVISNIVDGATLVGKGVGIVTILDDDLAPKVRSITSATVSEGNSSTHVVTLTNGSKFPTNVDMLMTNNGASIGGVSVIVGGVSSSIANPYTTNTIIVGAGLTSFNVKVDTVKDGVYRGTSEYVISAAIDGVVVSGNGTVTDENDRPKVSISSASAREGDNLVFYVYLDRNTLISTIVPYRLEHVTTTQADITGEVFFTKGVIYDELSGNIAIPAGVRSFEIVIPTVEDGTVEGLETLKVVVDGVVGIGSIASRVIDPEVPDDNIDSDSDAVVTVNVIDVDTYGLDEAELKANNMMVVGVDNKYDVQVEDLNELDITVAKKEYTIVGDDIYIPQLYDDAPQWMKDLVELVVDVSMTTNSTKLINDMNAMLQEFAVSYVPLNQYTQSILDLGNEDMRLNALIEILNSNFNNGLSNANAQIINLQMTKASKDEVVAQVIQTLAAQLADPNSNLGATVVRLDQAIVAEQTARATSFRALTASMESINGEIAAKAEVLENALAYVGIDEAGASTNTGLSAYLQASNGVIGGADSKVANDIRVTAEGVESKWAYNSTVSVNGVYRKSGFGLTANNFSGAGTQANPYTSEFWIDATKLRFTNSANTGRTAPFTIDATGVTPQIKFNGVVEFSNISNMPSINKTYVQTTQPTSGMNKGDTWIDTDDKNSLHTYTGSSWIKTDNGVKTYLQTNPPTSGMLTGDLWVDSDDNYKQYRYNGTSWEAYAFDAAYAINTNTTTINGSKITTGSITAAQINVNDLFSKNIVFTGSITGGNALGGGIIQSYNGKMKIDLVNGSLYIN